MEIRYITPDEAADYQRVSAASFIWKFNEEDDKGFIYGEINTEMRNASILSSIFSLNAGVSCILSALLK